VRTEGGKVKVEVFLPLLIVSFLFLYLVGGMSYSSPSRGEVITNGSFENNADNWTFTLVSGASIGAWDNVGYANGGCVKITSGQTVTTHYYAENLGETTWNTDTSYQDKVMITFTPPVTENYLIIASAEVAGSSESYQTWASLEVDSVIYQELKYRVKDTTDYYPFNALKKISLSGGSSHTLKVIFKTNNTGGTAKIRNARLLVWRVACEYAENETENTTTSTSPENRVTLTFTPSSAADYLIMATANVTGTPGLQYSTLNYLTINGENFASTLIEPSDNTAHYNFGVFKKVNLSGGTSHTINLQIASENEGYSAIIKYAHIAAIRLDLMNYYAENEEGLTPASANTWYLAASNTYSSESDNHLILGTLHYMAASASYSVGWRLNADTTTAQDLLIEGKDSTDYESAFTMNFGNLGAGSHTDNLEYMGELSSTAGVKNRRLICIRVPVKRESGEGYWEQILGASISSGSTVKLCYAWRKGYAITVPEQQDVYVTIVKPDNSTVDIDNQLGPPGSYDNWFTVDNKDVSSYFDQTGIYKLRLRYNYETGSDLGAQCVCWFDEVKLSITPPRDVDISVSPSYQSGLPGATLNYTVTIANMGNLSDTYDLVAGDNSGWSPTVFPASITVLPGTSENATLSVTVPMNAMGCTQDNVTVTATSQADNTISDSASCIAHATIVRGVEVSVSPSYQSGLNGETLDYTVTVSNTGNVEDTYSLAAADNAGWAPTVFPGSLTVPPWENRTATLSVTVPSNAIGCTEDLITLTARSQADNTVENSGNCIAHATIVRRVEVSISPSYQSGLPGTALSYVVTVANTGNVSDTYDLTASDNLGWGPTVFPASITVSPATSENASLSATVPLDAIGCTEDNITVTSTSQADNTVSDSDSCIAHASIVRGVDISISPSYQSGLNGATLNYTITVANTGNVSDTYDLATSDNTGWSPTVSPTSITVPVGASDNVTLSVTVPLGAIGCTEDNIVVIATSQADNRVRDNDSCIAHATITRGVDVSISPSYQDEAPGSTINYTVIVANTGNVLDTYDLVAGDNSGWSPSILPTSITVLPGASDNATLSVTVPMGAENCTRDNITVTATSQADNTVSKSASCIAHAIIILGVDVSVSPSYQSNLPGEMLYYTVTVANTGNVPDNYDLSVSDNSGWSLSISPTSVTVLAGASDNVLLSVVIPTGAENCTRDNIIVTATSLRDNSVNNSASCIAHARVGIDNHAPIYIVGNDNFTLANGVTSGSGTAFDPYIIQNWYIDTSSADGIEIKNTTAYFVIRNCRVYVWGYSNYGIYLNHAANGRIENTTIYSDNTGIYLNSSSNNSIKNCYASYNYFGYGFYLDSSDNNNLSNCTAYNNYHGIYLRYSSNNIVEKCTTSNNNSCGIFIKSSSDNNTISNCNSYNNTVGISISDGSDNNCIYRNNFKNNLYYQAFDECSNRWDNGYSVGGNYWSDYSGWDKYLGENQDIPGSDGIGDTPYNIPGETNQDRYPLVTKGLELSISPSYKEGMPGRTLGYAITIVNTGNVIDNYAFEISDNSGWGPTIIPPFLVVYPQNSENAILNVTIPDNAENCNRDEILVVARSQTDNTISDSGSCIAHAVIRGVGVSISPRYLSGLPGATLTYAVTIANTGMIDENYSLSTFDNSGWGLSVSPTSLSVRVGDNGVASLTVTIPASASSFTEDNITVTVASQVDNTVRDNDTCIAEAIVRGVGASISPDYQEGLPGSTLNYFVTVINTGETVDNFALIVSDNGGWEATLSENLLENMQVGENRIVTLSVTIPENAAPFTEDNLTVTATSLGDQTVSNSDSCIAQVLAVFGVDVTISPDYQSTHPGTEMNFTIVISNIGANVDNYTLAVSDNAGWTLTLLENLFENVGPDENRTTTLTVTIPDNVAPCTEDNVCVTATSMENAEVSGSGWCIAHAMPSKAEFSLVTLYQVSLDVDLYLENGSKLVVKFYTYENAFENENVIHVFTPPLHVEENMNVPHPGNIMVKRARLDLTYDNTENVISTIASFIVTKGILWGRLGEITSRWPYAPSGEKDALWKEIGDISSQWPYAP